LITSHFTFFKYSYLLIVAPSSSTQNLSTISLASHINYKHFYFLSLAFMNTFAAMDNLGKETILKYLSLFHEIIR
jgi:hypothetical protein